MGKKCGDLKLAHFVRMPLTVELDETPYPVNIGFLSPETVVANANFRTDRVQERGGASNAIHCRTNNVEKSTVEKQPSLPQARYADNVRNARRPMSRLFGNKE